MNLHTTRLLLSKFGIRCEYTADDAELVHHAIAVTHQHFGLARFQLGALLLAVKHKELWRGKAASFSEYLESERIKPSAAKQYMQVAEKFMFRLKLEDHHLFALSRISMTTLVKACDKINRENVLEIVDLLESLSDRDAKHALDDLDSHRKPLQHHEKKATNPKVRKIVNDFYSLPNDLRVELLRALRFPLPQKIDG